MDSFLDNFRKVFGLSKASAKKVQRAAQEDTNSAPAKEPKQTPLSEYLTLPEMLRYYEEKTSAPELWPKNYRPDADVDIKAFSDSRLYRELSKAQRRATLFLQPSQKELESAKNGSLNVFNINPAEPDEKAILNDEDYDFVNSTKNDFYKDLGDVMLKSDDLDVAPLREKYGNKSDFYNRLINRLEDNYLKNMKDSYAPGSDEWYEGLKSLYDEYAITVPGYLADYDYYRRLNRA